MNLKNQLVNSFSGRCASNNCLEELDLQVFEIVDDTQNSPCRIVCNDGHFKVENPHKRLLHFLKIDWCILLSTDPEKRCDFAVFSDKEMVLVELKTIEEGSKTTFWEAGKEVEKADDKFKKADAQLENTLKIFLRENIDLSVYQQNQKLFVIVSILDLNPPVIKVKAEAANQFAEMKYLSKYNAILRTGNIYPFS